MSTDYLPGNDAKLQVWLSNFTNVAGVNQAALGLNATDITSLTSAQSAFSYTVSTFTAQQASFHAASKSKATTRKSTVTTIRTVVRKIQGYPGVSAALKASLNINPHDGKRTHTPPTQPLSLVATPDSSGVNSLKWKRNGNSRTTNFLVEATTGAGKPFAVVGNTTKAKFDHTGQTPGVMMTYRVTATRADASSLPSLPVTVYGVGTTLVLDKAA